MPKLLLVEDEDMLLESLIAHFPWKECGITELHSARSGEEALELSVKHKPDILVTDLRMPGISGIELAARMREKNDILSILFISAYSDVEYLRKAMQLHAEDYIIKPVNYAELKRALLRMIQTINIHKIHHSNQRMIKTYEADLKISVLTSLLMRQNPMVLIFTQAEKIGLCKMNDTEIGWSVFMFSKSLADTQRLIESMHCEELYEERYIIMLTLDCTAVLYRHESKQTFEEQESAFMNISSHLSGAMNISMGYSSRFHVKSMQALYGIGAEFLLNRETHDRLQNSLNQSAQELTEQIIRAIRKQYSDPALSVSLLAEQLHYTKAYICNVFKKSLGITIHEYINQFRIEQARRMLKETHKSIGEISEETGYDNDSYFSRVFKKITGISPMNYRGKR